MRQETGLGRLLRRGLAIAGLFVTTALCAQQPAEDLPIIVTVGAYEFPPYASVDENFQVSGLVSELVDELNQLQSGYQLQVKGISAKRRYQDFDSQRYELIFWEMPEWGWDKTPHYSSHIIGEDQEVFVTDADYVRSNPLILKEPQKARMAAFLGYHYAFAEFETDENLLHQRFSIHLTSSHATNLELIQLKRFDVAEVALMPRSFLESQFIGHPEWREQLVTTERPDQIYRLRALLHPNAKLPVTTLNQWLEDLEQSGALSALRARFGVQDPGSNP